MPRMMTHRRASAGFSLVELMVGIAVGLVVLVGLSSVYINTVIGGRTTTASNQLSQELRALMDIMVNDLRRAGHSSAGVAGATNPFLVPTTVPVISNPAAKRDCILYSYDATFLGVTPGVPGLEDRFGFRLDDKGVVQAVQPGTLAGTDTPCANAAWEPLTDEVSTEVMEMEFDTVGSECIAFVANSYVATNPATFVHWKTEAGTGPACDKDADNAPDPYPDATHHFVETQQINIRLLGRSRTDPTLPTLELRETVLVRANRVIAPGP